MNYLARTLILAVLYPIAKDIGKGITKITKQQIEKRKKNGTKTL